MMRRVDDEAEDALKLVLDRHESYCAIVVLCDGWGKIGVAGNVDAEDVTTVIDHVKQGFLEYQSRRN